MSATEPHFDTTTPPFAGVVIALMGTVAEMELEAISERNRSAAQHNIKQGRYRGGSVPPWGGYQPHKDEASGDWRLVPDPAQVALVQEAARRVIAGGDSLNSICHDFTRRGGIKTQRGGRTGT